MGPGKQFRGWWRQNRENTGARHGPRAVQSQRFRSCALKAFRCPSFQIPLHQYLETMQTFTSWIVVLALTSGLPVYAATQSGGDWPQWRGPLRSGASPDAKPPLNWSETNNVKWKVK